MRSSARWRQHPPRTRVPPGLRPWLTDPGSLTGRIVERCLRFRVVVLGQYVGRAMLDDRAVLSVRGHERVWVREVLLVADERVVVYARSVLTLRSLRGRWRLFRGIGGRPLGAALFADPRIERLPLESTALDGRDARYHRASAIAGLPDRPERLWARRSRFRQSGRDLLVTEVFLPAILDLPA
ncbi:chorismate--pyruvate lyase family protein [Rhodocyclaceae bacterium SMB388]